MRWLFGTLTLASSLSTWWMPPTSPLPLTTGLEPTGLEGRPAPALDLRRQFGPRVPTIAELKGRAVLLFFWAHWCVECKAEGPIVAKLIEKYGSQGLVLIAPTQRYGYVAEGRSAPPDRELRYILQVRDQYYRFLRNYSVPISDVNAKRYGVDAVPTFTLIDRNGIVRLSHEGRMTEEDLEAVLHKVL